jgi:hypothetical protein
VFAPPSSGAVQGGRASAHAPPAHKKAQKITRLDQLLCDQAHCEQEPRGGCCCRLQGGTEAKQVALITQAQAPGGKLVKSKIKEKKGEAICLPSEYCLLCVWSFVTYFCGVLGLLITHREQRTKKKERDKGLRKTTANKFLFFSSFL